MPRTPKPGRAIAAARHALVLEHDVSMAEAGRRRGVSRQAVSAAKQRLFRPRGRVGKPARAGAAATRNVTIRLAGRRIGVHLTESEYAAWTRAAAEAGLTVSAWARRLLGRWPCPASERMGVHLRAVGNLASES